MPEELYTKKEYQSLLLKTLGRSPMLRIIDFFMDNPFSGFTTKEAIEALGMDKEKFYNHFKDLEELKVVKVSRRRRRTVYKINMKHPLVKGLYKMVTQISLKIAEEERKKIENNLRHAIKLYMQGKVSLGRAAEMANMGVIEFKDKIARLGYKRVLVVTKEDIKEVDKLVKRMR